MHEWQVRSTICEGFRKAEFPTDCFENNKMLEGYRENACSLAKTDETSAMKFANGDKDVEITEVLSSSNLEAEVLANFIDEECEEMDVDAADENPVYYY
ncbi:Recombination protein RecR [Trichinella pseudospiralis]